MSLSSTLLVLLSASMHVFWNSLVKASPFPVAFMGLKGAFLILVALLVVPLIGLTGVSPAAWPPIVLSGVFHAAYALALARAYEQGDISFVYPIAPHDFWEATRSEGKTVKPPTIGNHARVHQIPIFNIAEPEERWPVRIEVMAYVRPVGRDVLEDLLGSGHLTEPEILRQVPTLPIQGSYVAWDREQHEMDEQVYGKDQLQKQEYTCPNHYRCLLDNGIPCP